MKTEYLYQIGDELKRVTIEPNGDRFRVTVDDQVYEVAAEMLDNGQLSLSLVERRLQAYVASRKTQRYVAIAGETWTLERCDPQQTSLPSGARAAGGTGQGNLTATMPGLVLDVLVAEGDLVERGQTLALLEAMKMELRISAPYNGRVRQVCCAAGQVVERGQLLVEIEEN